MSRKIAYLFAISVLLLGVAGCQPGGNDSAAIDAYGAKDYVSTLQITGEQEKSGDTTKVSRTLHAWAWFQLGHYNEALREFRRLQQDEPNDFHPWLGEAWILMKQGQFQQVPALLDKAEKWMGQHQRPMLYAARGWLAFYQGNIDQAAELFDATEQHLYFEDANFINIPEGIMRTWNTLPWVGRGWVAISRGKPEAAEKAFLKGIENDPGCHLCYAGLTALAEQHGDIDQAIEFAKKGLAVSRHDPELVTTLNRLLVAKAKPKLAEHIYRELVKISHNDPLYLANLGYIHLYRGEIEEAAKAFSQALRDEPGQYLASSGLKQIQAAGFGQDIASGHRK